VKDISHHFTHIIMTFLKQFLHPSLVLMTDNIPKINFLLFIPRIKLVTYNTQPTKCTEFVMYICNYIKTMKILQVLNVISSKHVGVSLF